MGLCLLGAWLGLALPAHAAKAKKKHAAAKEPKAAPAPTDPSHWFATKVGLIRVYQERKAPPPKGKKPKATEPADEEAAKVAGASCEVVESRAREGVEPGLTRESCTMIVGRMPKNASRLSYELRSQGIFMVQAETEGAARPGAAPGAPPARLDRLLLPSPLTRGKKWSEKRGKVVLARQVKSAGQPCKAASRTFGDCLVISVKETEKKKVRRTYSETYAAGVGLVEDGQWELLDLKGL